MSTRPARRMRAALEVESPDRCSAAEGGPTGRASDVFPTPWGSGRISVSGGRLVEVDLPSSACPDASAISPKDVLQQEAGTQADQRELEHWLAQLQAYFAGERLSWTPEEVGLEGLGFGRFRSAVYRALMSVPAGVTVSYGALASLAGYPRAARAVGTAMASNPLPIVIPCHRVIRSDGSLGNYGNDPALKEVLLAHERRWSGKANGDGCE